MADTSSLHPRVRRFVMAFYALGIVMWLGGFIASTINHHTLMWVFYGVLYTQCAMVVYGNTNRAIRNRRRRWREANDFFNYQVQLQLAMKQQQMQQQIYYETMKKLELARRQQETYRQAKALLQQQLYQQQQHQQQRWSIASDQYVDAIRELKDLT